MRRISIITAFLQILLVFATQLRPIFSFVASVPIRQGIPSLTLYSTTPSSGLENDEKIDLVPARDVQSPSGLDRREILFSMIAAASLLPLAANAASDPKSVTDMYLGDARWEKLDRSEASRSSELDKVVPASFVTYLARFLINYDEGVASWWQDLNESSALLSDDQRNSRLGRKFGSLAASLQISLNSFLLESANLREGYQKLLRILLEKYGTLVDAQRHVGILFSTLPKSLQPTASIRMLLNEPSIRKSSSSTDGDSDVDQRFTGSAELSSLLPGEYKGALSEDDSYFSIQPQIDLYEVGVAEEFGMTATATAFGPLSTQALKRDLPDYSAAIYGLFAVSGATGCVLTHSVVIPLDVVKTKAQTDPENYSNIFAGASRILKEDGIQGLLTGAQATMAGYFWYGLSVYPSYAFFKRFIGQSALPADFAIAHTNDVALIAGALASVVASIGLTPLEAARIRVVTDPGKYKPLGLLGTLDSISNEDPSLGWKATYAGFPSLLTRQVLFGSVKFLAFERACEFIFAAWPFLRDATWTCLAVSLVAGGCSGALSSVVSQPADAVLTYVAKRNDGKGTLGVIEGSKLMIEESGVSSLFRGLGSRSLWAGSIIAGQFLLYDIFRGYFGVSVEDLSQVFQVEIYR
jgi:solute carrier family 25 phosphate transporter 3